jgi:hypothetical protein
MNMPRSRINEMARAPKTGSTPCGKFHKDRVELRTRQRLCIANYRITVTRPDYDSAWDLQMWLQRDCLYFSQ